MKFLKNTIASWVRHGKGLYLIIAAAFLLTAVDMMAQTYYQVSLRQRRLGDQIGVEVWAKRMSANAPRIGNMSVAVTYNTDFLTPAAAASYAIGTTDSVDFNVNQASPYRTITSAFGSANGYQVLAAQATNNGVLFINQLDVRSSALPNTQAIDAETEGRGSFMGRLVFDITNHATLTNADLTGIAINQVTSVGDFRIFDATGADIEANTELMATSSMTIRGISLLNPNGPNEAVNRNKQYLSLAVAGYPIYFERSGLITPAINSEYGTNLLGYAVDYSVDGGTSWSEEVIRFAETRETQDDLSNAVPSQLNWHVSSTANQIVTNTGNAQGFYVTQGNGSQLPVPSGDGYGGVVRIIWQNDPFFSTRSEQARLRIKQLATSDRAADINLRAKPVNNPFAVSDANFILSRLFFLQLSGDNTYMKTRDNFATPTNFTVEAWINPNSLTAQAGVETGIIATGPGTTAPEIEGSWMLYLKDGVYPAFKVREIIGGAGRGVNGSQYLADISTSWDDAVTTTSDVFPINNNPNHNKNWYHLAAVVEGNSAKLYVNGELAASYTNTNAIDIRPFTSNHPIWVGVNPNFGFNNGDFLHAGIKEVKIWRKALTHSEIRSFVMGVPNPTNVGLGTNAQQVRNTLEMYYSFDGTANDLASAANSTGITQNGSQQNGANPILYYDNTNPGGTEVSIPEERFPYRPDLAHIKITSPYRGVGVTNLEDEVFPVRWVAYGVGDANTLNSDDITIEFSRDGGQQWAFAIDNQAPAQILNEIDAETSTANWEPYNNATLASSYNDLQAVLAVNDNYNKVVRLRVRGLAANNQTDIMDVTEDFNVAPYFALRTLGNQMTIAGGTQMNLLGGAGMIESWIKPYRFPTQQEAYFPILAKQDSAGGSHYSLNLLANGTLEFRVTDVNGVVRTATSSTATPIETPYMVNNELQWTHVAVWFNLGNGAGQSTVRFYIDGKVQRDAQTANQLGMSVAVNANNTFPTFIGYEPGRTETVTVDGPDGPEVQNVAVASKAFVGEMKGLRYWNGNPGGSTTSGSEPTQLTNFIRGALTVDADELLAASRTNLVAAFDFSGGALHRNDRLQRGIFSNVGSSELRAELRKNTGVSFVGNQPYLKLVEPIFQQIIPNSSENTFVRWVGFHFDAQGFTTGNATLTKDSDLEYSVAGGGNIENAPYNPTASDNTNLAYTDAFSLPLTNTYRFLGTNPPHVQFAGNLNLNITRDDNGTQAPVFASNTQARLRFRGRTTINTLGAKEYLDYSFLRVEGPVFTITPASNFTVRALLEGYHKGSVTQFTGVLGNQFETNGMRISLYSNNSGVPGTLVGSSTSESDYSDKDPLSGLGTIGTDGARYGNINFIFTDIVDNDYFVLVEHQNHLPVLSRFAAPFAFSGDDLATWGIESGWDFASWGGTQDNFLTESNAATRPLPTIGNTYTAFGNAKTSIADPLYGNTGLRYNDGQDGTNTNPLGSMVAGDVQRDGQINSADRVKVRVDAGGTAQQSDVTGDGVVNNLDRDIVDRNTGITSSVAELFPNLFGMPSVQNAFSVISPIDAEMSHRLNQRAIARNNGEFDHIDVTSKTNMNQVMGVGVSYDVYAETTINDEQTHVQVAIYMKNVGEPFAPGNSTFAIKYESTKLKYVGIARNGESPWNNRADLGYDMIYSAPTPNSPNPVSDLRTLEIDYDSYARLAGFNVPYSKTIVGVLVFEVRDAEFTNFAFSWDKSSGVLRTDGKNVTGDGIWHDIEAINTNRTAEIITPNGGEVWKAGSSYTIKWTVPTNDQDVNLELSADAGSTWVKINTEAFSAKTGEYNWITSNVNSTECVVRLVDATTGVEIDRSNSYFSILPTANFITSPSATDPIYFAGQQGTIKWVAEDAQEVIFYFSPDGMNNWTKITANVNAQSGQVSFVTPSNVNSKNAVVAMYNAVNDQFLAVSEPFRVLSGNLTFVTPQGGEVFKPADKKSVRWNSNNIAHFDLQLSINGGANWTTIEQGQNALKAVYNWNIPNVQSDKVMLRAIYNGDNDLEFARTGAFTIDGNGATSVEENLFSFNVSEPFPNPTNAMTQVSVTIPENAKLTVEVYSATGMVVATLSEGMAAAGNQNFTFDGTNLPSGVYYIKVSTGVYNEVREIVLNK